MSTISVEDTQYWSRLSTAAYFGGSKALYEIWKDPKRRGPGIPNSQAKLYQYLNGIPSIKSCISKGQLQLVLPSNKRTDVSRFDVTISAALLLHVTWIKPSPNLTPLKIDDPSSVKNAKSDGDFISYIRDFRNALLHYEPTKISEQQFNDYWSILEQILQGLQYDVANIAELKCTPIDEMNDNIRIALLLNQDFQQATSNSILRKQDDVLDTLQEMKGDQDDTNGKIRELQNNQSEQSKLIKEQCKLIEEQSKLIEEKSKLIEENNKSSKGNICSYKSKFCCPYN